MEQKYYDYIVNLDIGSRKSEQAWLSSDLNSTDLMTRLKHGNVPVTEHDICKNPFDILYLRLFNKRYYINETLVVINIPEHTVNMLDERFSFIGRSITFTELKKKWKSMWYSSFSNEPSDLMKLSNDKILKLWKKPYLLKAVTEYDKDFRKEWRDGWLEYEGNEFGDTSNFYIIGCLGQ